MARPEPTVDTGQLSSAFEPCVSWDQSLLPAAQQALLRSGVGGKKPLWLARALVGTACVPKDGLPCSQRHLWCGQGKKRAKGIPLDPGPAPFALTRPHLTQSSPDSTSSSPGRTDATAPERSPAPQNSQDTLDPSKGLGWGRRTYERVRKELNPQHCQPSLLLLC